MEKMMFEDDEISKSNKIKIIVITAVVLLVSIIGVSYAYFTINIVGNDTASSMRLRTANYNLVYNDVQIISGEYEQPGWTDTKVLTVTNNGNVTAYYTIIWRDLVNEVNNGELVISAECSSSSGTCDDLDETIVPTYLSEAHNIKVKRNISIASGVTHTYTLTALFKDTGSVQNYNQNKYFNGTLNIEEYEPSTMTRVGTDSTTGLSVVKIDDEEFFDLTNAINYSSLVSTNGNLYNYSSGKTVLLAKYDLDLSVGMQTSSLEYEEYEMAFSETEYWANCTSYNQTPMGLECSNGEFKSQYGSLTNNANNIYDSNYADLSGNNYSIAYYVENYLSRFEIDGIGRILTYTEANAMTQTQRANGQKYWLGTASEISLVNAVGTDGNIGGTAFNGDVGFYGVRPVIVVNTADIQSAS